MTEEKELSERAKLQAKVLVLANKRDDMLDQFKFFHKQLPKLMGEIANFGVSIARMESEIKLMIQEEQEEPKSEEET